MHISLLITLGCSLLAAASPVPTSLASVASEAQSPPETRGSEGNSHPYRLKDWFHDLAADSRSDKVHYTAASPSSSRSLAGVANEKSPSVKLAPRGIDFSECDVKLTPELCVVLGYMMAFEAGLDAGHDQRE